MFGKVLVANRGEIAVRVFRACRELGIGTVAVYSDADRHAGHVRFADEAYNVGPAPASESYLNQDRLLDIASTADVDAIHPGYGFLAENAAFARTVESSPFTWVGPPGAVMEQLGEKTTARRVMQAADVPVIPGTTEPITSVDAATETAAEIGYPIAIKSVGGGGGRGLVVVDGPDGIEDAHERARREGEAYFDNPEVYIERYLSDPKHIEVQILADHHGTVRQLGERDCSLQRRHQKLIEEAPSPSLDDELRATIGEAARRGIAETGYTNAGTVEFLVDGDDFYFMEVNTRIQVEHCVTEAITGIDLVKWQLLIAMGESLDVPPIEPRGHAIEFRINAENPAADFTPNGGTLTTYDPPGGIGVRVDDAVRQGDAIGGEYDSLIAKLIVHAPDRAECLARSDRALAEFEIEGLHTTIPFHRLMVADETFRAGAHTTSTVGGLDPDRLVAAVDRWGPQTRIPAVGEPEAQTYFVEVDGKRFEVAIEAEGRQPTDRQAGADRNARQPEAATSTPSADGTDHHVVADMQGTILDIAVEPGDTVSQGQVVCVLEAMKMENDVVAPRGGTVTEVTVEVGDGVDMGDVLVTIE